MPKQNKTIEELVDETLLKAIPGFPGRDGPPSPSLLLGATPQDIALRSACCRAALRFPSAKETEQFGGALVCRICGNPQQ